MKKPLLTITPPLSRDVVASLSAGDEVLITGTIYTARDAAHKLKNPSEWMHCRHNH